MEHLIEAFERMQAHSHVQGADADKSDPSLPRVPYKVEEVGSTSQNEIAHFRHFYKNPTEVISKLTLVRSDLARSNRTTKKPSGS